METIKVVSKRRIKLRRINIYRVDEGNDTGTEIIVFEKDGKVNQYGFTDEEAKDILTGLNFHYEGKEA